MRLYRRMGSTFASIAAVAALVAWLPTAALGRDDGRDFAAQLTSFDEVPTLSTPGHGTLKLHLSPSSITYELSYSGLTTPATVAHLHLGRPAVNGGVIAFLCGGGTKPACPPSGTVTGTIVASDILGPSAQGLAPGDMAAAQRAIRNEAVYTNVHTTTFPAGEIRGQLLRVDLDDGN